MKRTLTFVLVSSLAGHAALAQPAERPPAATAGTSAPKAAPKKPAAKKPRPKAAAPADPYADPTPADVPAADPARTPDGPNGAAGPARPGDPFAPTLTPKRDTEPVGKRPSPRSGAPAASPAIDPNDPRGPGFDPAASPVVPPEAPVAGAPRPGARPPSPSPSPSPSIDPKRKPGKAAPADPYAEHVPADPYAGPAKPGTPHGAPEEPTAPAIPARVGVADVTAVQGLLAVQRLDGWLLFDRDGENPIAVRLVSPEGHPTRPWFYMIPAKGEPITLVHSAELRSFDHLPGKKLTYQGYRDLDQQLRAMLKGVKTVAVEYSAKAAVPSVSRVDAGTLELIRGTGVQVKSSDTLVQFTKAIWGDAGRTAHYVAVHHLVELRKDALAFVAKQVAAGQPVTEYDVQQRLVRGMTMRGLVGSPPVVAAGVNTADPYYVPTAAKAAPIKRGDLIVISLALKVDKPEGIWAAQTWCAVADSKVPAAVAKAFETTSLARDQALALIADRSHKHRPVTGADVDDATRGFFKKAGVVDRVLHRTGHSIDNDLQGSGADLDDFEVKDTRILTPGTGFTVGPGLYFSGALGVRAEVSVYLAPTGPEVTTPAQDEVETLFKP